MRFLLVTLWQACSDTLSLASAVRNFDEKARGKAALETYEQGQYSRALEICNAELLQHPGSQPAHSAIAIVSAAIASQLAQVRALEDALVPNAQKAPPEPQTDITDISTSARKTSERRFTVVVFTAIFTDDPYSIRDLLKPIGLGFNKTAKLQLAAVHNSFEDGSSNQTTQQCMSEVEVDVEFVCFTNSYRVISNGDWRVRYVPLRLGGGRMSARYFKIMSHTVLPDAKYRYSIWLDPTHALLKHPVALLQHALQMQPVQPPCPFDASGSSSSVKSIDSRAIHGIGCGSVGVVWGHQHNDRNCAYEEAEVCMQNNKGDPKRILAQTKRYRRHGFPRKFKGGLIDTAVLLRDHNSLSLRRFNEQWWDEIVEGSVRDQVSLPYISWLNQVHVRWLGGMIRDGSKLNIAPSPHFVNLYHSNVLYAHKDRQGEGHESSSTHSTVKRTSKGSIFATPFMVNVGYADVKRPIDHNRSSSGSSGSIRKSSRKIERKERKSHPTSLDSFE